MTETEPLLCRDKQCKNENIYNENIYNEISFRTKPISTLSNYVMHSIVTFKISKCFSYTKLLSDIPIQSLTYYLHSLTKPIHVYELVDVFKIHGINLWIGNINRILTLWFCYDSGVFRYFPLQQIDVEKNIHSITDNYYYTSISPFFSIPYCNPSKFESYLIE